MVCNGILYYNYYCIILLQCVCVCTMQYTVEFLIIKDILNKGHLTTRDTFLSHFDTFSCMLNDPSTKDIPLLKGQVIIVLF